MSGPVRGRRALGGVLVSTAALLALTACGSDWTETEPEAAATTTATTTAPSSTAAATTSTPTGDSSPGSADGELGEDAEGRRLTLADFFEPGSQWEEERYNIADQRDVPGIGTQIAGCYGFQELELRLGNNFDTLEFSVAQANDSRESDQNVSVEVLANNSQVEIRSVPFNQIQSFSIPVSGVNALKIQMSLDDRVDGCGGSVIAVLTDATLD
jgi:hypothetical protein